MRSPFTSNHDASLLRSVIFVPGYFSKLFSGRFPYDQLDAIGEILDFANSYVLNDVVALSGFSFGYNDDSFAKFVKAEIKSSESVETIGYGTRYGFDITPFDASLKLMEYESRLKEMDRATEKYKLGLADRIDPSPLEKDGIRSMEIAYNQLADEARVLQQQSYILLADRLQATYVPERLYGRRAIEAYPMALRRAVHSTEEEFRKRLSSEIESPRHGGGVRPHS